MTLWLVPGDAPGLSRPGGFDGLGLRGNGSTPVTADGVRGRRRRRCWAPTARGLDIALAVVLPWFLVLSAAFSVGLMEAVTAEAAAHLHDDAARAPRRGRWSQQPVAAARLRPDADRDRRHAGPCSRDTLAALETGREDAMLRVLEVKAAAAEASLEVTDLAMKLVRRARPSARSWASSAGSATPGPRG